MKSFAFLSLAALVVGAAALPTNDDYKKEEYKKHDHKDDYKKEDAKEHSLSAFPFHFTSTYHAYATADQIIAANGTRVPGEEGAYGLFNFGINSAQDVICYNITLVGVTGQYSSPARTATHIHEAAKGKFGPPRLSFENPTGSGRVRTSFGCQKGPFTTGLNATSGALQGQDTATGFTLSQIEENPSGFTADTHTARFLAGAVRGQLEQKW